MRKEDIIQDIIDYFNGDSLAGNVLVDKYFNKDKDGNLLETTPVDFFNRLVGEIKRIEDKYPNPMCWDEIFEMFDGFKYFTLGGSPLYGIGTDSKTSLSNCFVIGSNSDSDSYGSILRTDEEQIQLMKRRGGVGHDLSHLRPSGSYANNSVLSGLAGSVLYAERYSNSTKEVRQGDRRGALMLTMSINHPDAEKFIDSKLELGKITDANISIRITDEFMKAVKKNGFFIQKFPIDLDITYHEGFMGMLEEGTYKVNELYNLQYKNSNEYKGCYAKVVKAKTLWNKIIKNAHQSAEPGVLFWDTIINNSPADLYENFGFKTVSTNPCGELPLSPYDSCRLAPINLFSYVKNPFESDAEFDFNLLKNNAYKAQRIMDDMIDMELEKIDLILKKIETDPEPRNIKEVEKELWMKVKHTAQAGRRTGLGITGFGDCLAALGITYGSPESLVIGEEISKTIAIESYKSSIDMAKERGCFEVFNFENEINGINNITFLSRVWNKLDAEYKDKWVEFGRRNIANLSIAPTGTVSLLTQTSSGIEPAFSIRYKRRRRSINPELINFTDENGETYQEYYVFHHKFEEWYDRNWYKLDSKLFDIGFKKPLDTYNDDEFQLLFEKSPWYKATANDVDWVSKVSLQGLVQRWVDHSISATTNIPKQTSVKTVDDIYMTAWESGCKGMTIYRDGSRSGILVTKEEFKYASEITRDTILKCDIYNKTVLKEEWMIIVGLKNDIPYEIFAFPKLPNHIFPARLKAGFVEKVKGGVYRLVSREGDKTYEIPNIIELIDENGQTNTRRFSIMLRHGISPKAISEDIQKYALVTSFDKAIQRVLQNYMKIENVCPECGSELTNQDGCIKCMGCGWSRC